MGCCTSTLDKNKEIPLKKDHQFPSVVLSKSPPRPEEETVKEVLSETSKPDSKPEIKLSKNVDLLAKSRLLVSPLKPFLGQKVTITPEKEISEVSEICSLSLSENISNTTLEDQQMQCGKHTATSGNVNQRAYRSQGHSSNFTQMINKNISDHNVQLKNHGRSAVRRAEPSLPRRYSGPSRVRENSAPRRSRSPATRPNVGRSLSAGRMGPSPDRVRMFDGTSEVRNAHEDEWDGPKESLENPLVSLECFIFL